MDPITQQMQWMQGAASDAPAGNAAVPLKQNMGLMLAQMLSANPTPETAQKIIQHLKQVGNPEADKFEQVLSQAGNNPQALKQIADGVIQKLSGK